MNIMAQNCFSARIEIGDIKMDPFRNVHFHSRAALATVVTEVVVFVKDGEELGRSTGVESGVDGHDVVKVEDCLQIEYC